MDRVFILVAISNVFMELLEMRDARGYISHSMMGRRSVPQRVQQIIIKSYCEQNDLQFLLSATEFEGQSIMLESIKEDTICMYSIWNMPKNKVARQLLYDSGKDVRFAAENIHSIDKDFLETVFSIEDYHAGSQFRETVAYLKSA